MAVESVCVSYSSSIHECLAIPSCRFPRAFATSTNQLCRGCVNVKTILGAWIPHRCFRMQFLILELSNSFRHT